MHDSEEQSLCSRGGALMNEPKVVAQLSISCGCGFCAKTSKEGADHAKSSGHVLTVHGQIGTAERMSQGKVEVRRG